MQQELLLCASSKNEQFVLFRYLATTLKYNDKKEVIIMMNKNQVLIIDLNNFARYPTLAIGYLVSPLRQAGFDVNVLSPLSHGIPPQTHEKEETWLEHIKRRINFSLHPLIQRSHETLRRLYAWKNNRYQRSINQRVLQTLETNPPKIILLSAYLEHYDLVQAIAQVAKQKEIPVLLGGPAFSQIETIQEWLVIEGVTAIFAGEADPIIAPLVQAVLENKPLDQWQGVFDAKNSSNQTVAPPLRDLDNLPIPDFQDFPWHLYPHRIIPIMTGRGCSWNMCTFCSDVITSNGRTFRSRSLEHVLNEIKTQTNLYQSHDFIFLDLKLNSDLVIWYGIIQHIQTIAPNARWIATVHVDGTGENGLDAQTLQTAKRAGLARISFGLETASAKLLRRMGKGSRIERNSQFIYDAYQAGLSVRCSMMIGYPNETVEDLQLTYNFLKVHENEIDRIRVARFKAIPNTRFAKHYQHKPQRFNQLSTIQWDHRYARATYKYDPEDRAHYRMIKQKLLNLIHTINKKPLRDQARQFDGLM